MNTEKQTEAITLVLGGTGKTGRRIVRRLTALGVATRVGSRSGDPAFDWDNSHNWDQVLKNVSSVYINFAPDLAVPGATEAINRFMEQAIRSGVKRVVLLSGRGEEEAQRCEAIIQRDNIEWTVVRASWFMQNFSEGAFMDMIMNGEVLLPAGEITEPFVDADDIADVAVAALTEDGHNGQIYEVTGPRLLSFAEAVTEIAKACGRPIRYQTIPVKDFIEAAKAAGIPTDLVWLLEYLFTSVLDGRNEYLTDGVQRALGRAPNDFSHYAQRVAATGIWKVAV